MGDAKADIAGEIEKLREDISHSRMSTLALRQEYADALSGALAARDAQLADLQKEADARLAALDEATLAAQTFEAEYLAHRDSVESWQRSCANETQARLAAEAHAAVLQRICDEREEVIGQLQAAADERLAALLEATAALEHLRSVES